MGIIMSISKSTNTTVQTSGTSFSASILRALMKDQFDNANGNVATDIYVGSYLSNEIDSFSNKTGITYDGIGAKNIVNAVDVLMKQGHLKFDQMLETLKDIITYKVKILCMTQWTISRKDVLVGSLA